MPEGHQSPPPERQSGKQLHEPTASGHGLDKVDIDPKSQLEVGPSLAANDTIIRNARSDIYIAS